MNPNVTKKDDCNIRNSTNIPSHGSIPKWLEEITSKISNEQSGVDVIESVKIHNGKNEENNKPMGIYSSKVVDDFVHTEGIVQDAAKKPVSAKYGRRSSVSKEITENMSKNIKLTNSDYLVPTFNENFDLREVILGESIHHENFWKNFNQPRSNKGNFKDKHVDKRLEEVSNNLANLSCSSDTELENMTQSKSIGKKRRCHSSKHCIQLKSESRKNTTENSVNVQQTVYRNNSKYHIPIEYNYINGDDDIFVIPKLPVGKVLVLQILSTWGDKYYVGLNGIEIFDANGQKAQVEKIFSDPSDVNILPECQNDPRVIQNLLDGVNRTQDPRHIWLAPLQQECHNVIVIEFTEITTIAMMRIWNYNKSRIHSYRGVQNILIFLDNDLIFKGEIVRASGTILGSIHHFGDTILFTTEEKILEQISRNDSSYSNLKSEPVSPQYTKGRPPTAIISCESRPVTKASAETSSSTGENKNQILFGASCIMLVLLGNWGCPRSIGLTGIEIYNGDIPITLSPNQLRCFSGNQDVHRLINGINVTTESQNMWLSHFENEEIIISIDLNGFKYLSGINIWNYNQDLELSYAGVQAMSIYLDGKPLINPFNQSYIYILRRAPGNQNYNYVQTINFSEYTKEDSADGLHVDLCPNMMGFVIQFVIYSTWGDKYYCGLNGFKLLDENDENILLSLQNICAFPESVNSITDIRDDIRIPDKLIDGINSDHSGKHSWLAPIIPKHLNRVYVVMDRPIAVSSVIFWNYSKTPERGMKDFGVFIDDILIFTGTLEKSNQRTNEYQIIKLCESAQENEKMLQQDMTLLNDISKDLVSDCDIDENLRPFTCLNPSNRTKQ